jgi:hypothetical protein
MRSDGGLEVAIKDAQVDFEIFQLKRANMIIQ